MGFSPSVRICDFLKGRRKPRKRAKAMRNYAKDTVLFFACLRHTFSLSYANCILPRVLGIFCSKKRYLPSFDTIVLLTMNAKPRKSIWKWERGFDVIRFSNHQEGFSALEKEEKKWKVWLFPRTFCCSTVNFSVLRTFLIRFCVCISA